MSDVYYYGNTPMLKYQSGSTPCAIPIDKVAADLIESLQAEVKAANDRLSASRANVGLLQAKVEGWEKSYQDYWMTTIVILFHPHHCRRRVSDELVTCRNHHTITRSECYLLHPQNT